MPALKSSSTEPPGRGRRTLLTPDLQERICALIRQGTYDYSAAEACGIARNTFFEWLARGEDRDKQRRGDRRYASFACAVRRARAEARALAEIQIKKIDPKWWLSRMHRDQPGEPAWSNPQRTELPGNDDQTISVVALKRYMAMYPPEEPERAAIEVEARQVRDGEPKR